MRNLPCVRALGFGLLTCIAAVSQVKADGFTFSNGVFTSFNIPGLNGTVPTAINNLGQIVGSDGNENIGFVYQNGNSTLLSPLLNGSIRPVGINDSGTIVGNQLIPGHGFSAFLDTGGTFTTLPVPFAVATGINNSGQVVGYAGDNLAMSDAFVYANGSTTYFSQPGATSTSFLGISNNDQILGHYIDSTGHHHYFIYDFNSGLVTPLTIPCAVYGLFGLNSHDEVVGGCGATGLAFEFNYATNQYTTITVPNSVDTFVLNINDNGQLVGFDNTVPEPATVSLLALGLGALLFTRIRRVAHP